MSYLYKYKNLFVFLLFIFVFNVSVYAQSAAAREFNDKAYAAMQSGLYKEATDNLKKAMEIAPTWGEPVFNAANLMRLRKNDAKAFALYKKAYELEPKNKKYAETYAQWIEAKIKVANVNSPEAMELKSELIKVNPRKLNVALEVVNYTKSNKNLKAASQIAKKVVDANSDLKGQYDSTELGQLYLILAEQEYVSGNIDSAKKYSDDARRFPNVTGAESLAEKIRKEQKSSIDDFISRADKAEKAGRYNEAEKILEEASSVAPNNSTIEQKKESIKIAREVTNVVNIAKKLENDERWSEMIDKMESCVENFPEGSNAIKLYEKAVEKEKEFAKSIGAFGGLPRNPKERTGLVNKFYTEGEKFTEAGNNKDAKGSYEKAIKLIEYLKIKDKDTNEIKSKCEKRLNDLKQIKLYEKTWKEAQDKRNSEDYDKVIELLNKIPETLYLNDKEYIQLPSLMAEALWKTDKLDEAIKYADIQIGLQPENNRAKFVKASIFLDRGEKDTAYKLFKEIEEVDPDYPGLSDKVKLSMLSESNLILVGVIVVIIICIFIAYSVFKKLPEYRKNSSISMAKRLLKSSNYDDCIQTLNEIKRLPNLTEWDIATISRILGQAFLKKGIYDKAIGECKHLITLNAKDEEAHTWLAQAYVGRRMISPESLPELLNLFQKEPRNIALISLLGSHYTKQKNLTKEGVQVLEQWLALEPTNPEVLKSLGRHYLLMSKSDDKAMTVFQRLMEMMVSQNAVEPDFLLGIARMHLKMQHYEDALHLCEQVINADINNELVHSVLLDVYTKQGNLDELINIYGNFLQENPYNVAFQNGLMEAKKRISAIARGEQQKADNERRAMEAQRRREESERRRLEQEQARLEAEQAEQAEQGEEMPQENYDDSEYAEGSEVDNQSYDENAVYDENSYQEPNGEQPENV